MPPRRPFALVLEPLDLPRFIAGSLIYFLPGWTWTWALLPQRHPLHRIPIAIVVAFTLQPAVLFLLHLAAGLALTAFNVALLSAVLAAAGIAVRMAGRPPPWSLDRLAAEAEAAPSTNRSPPVSPPTHASKRGNPPQRYINQGQ